MGQGREGTVAVRGREVDPEEVSHLAVEVAEAARRSLGHADEHTVDLAEAIGNAMSQL